MLLNAHELVKIDINYTITSQNHSNNKYTGAQSSLCSKEVWLEELSFLQHCHISRSVAHGCKVVPYGEHHTRSRQCTKGSVPEIP